jgi:hypothetical protein
MKNYASLIALSYFNQYKDNYVLSDLIQILGMTMKKFDDLLSELFSKQYIEYRKNLITITESGTSILVAANMYHYDNDDHEYATLHIDKKAAIPIDQPYVPDRFFTKVRKKSS